VYKFGTRLLLISLISVFWGLPAAKAQFQQAEPPAQEDPADYSESALRRFEIITLSSLPFTAIHSYIVVRGVKMYRENLFAPELTQQDYRIIGIGAVSLSLFIGIWDWLHTRNVDRSAPRVPEPKAPPAEEQGPEETLARLSKVDPYIARYKMMSREAALNNRLNSWVNEPATGLAIPLLQIRF